MTLRSFRFLPGRAIVALCACWLALQVSAVAHHLPPGFEEVDEFDDPAAMSAFLHPFTGLDHLFVALAVGWMAWQWGRSRGAGVALLFLGGMAAGAALSSFRVALPLMEPALALSMAACGLALLMRRPALFPLVAASVAAAGIWHGGAHAVELNASSSVWMTASFLAGTAALMALGSVLAAVLSRFLPPARHLASACLVVFGLALCVARLA